MLGRERSPFETSNLQRSIVQLNPCDFGRKLHLTENGNGRDTDRFRLFLDGIMQGIGISCSQMIK